MPHPRMRPRPPVWMPGADAIAHICQVDRCSEAVAIEQLRKAIVASAVRARLPDPRNLDRAVPVSPFPAFMAVLHHDLKKTPTSEMWSKAEIHADGTVKFRESPCWYAFVVLRDDIAKWESVRDSAKIAARTPATPNTAEATMLARKAKRGAAPADILDAIDALEPEHILNLRPKERNERIRVWLVQNKRKVPAGANGLPKAVQRALNQRAAKPSP